MNLASDTRNSFSPSATPDKGTGISSPWMPSKDGGASTNPLPPIPYPEFMKMHKDIFGPDVFEGGGWSAGAGLNSNPTSQGGGPVSGDSGGSSWPGPNTMYKPITKRGFDIMGGAAGG